MRLRDYALRYLELVGPFGFSLAASFGFLVGAIIGIRGGMGVAFFLAGCAFFLGCAMALLVRAIARLAMGLFWTMPSLARVRAGARNSAERTDS